MSIAALLTRLVQNEYAQQLRQLREQENSGKAYGKVFVKGTRVGYGSGDLLLTLRGQFVALNFITLDRKSVV